MYFVVDLIREYVVWYYMKKRAGGGGGGGGGPGDCPKREKKTPEGKQGPGIFQKILGGVKKEKGGGGGGGARERGHR